MKKVIYDFGSNNGDDIPYYLRKADVVVAVEANPDLCEIIASRFGDEISSGRLFVENCVLNVDADALQAEFYLNKEHVLSQFPRPDDSVASQFTRVVLPSRTPLAVIQQYGPPYYIKIDIEQYDHVVLEHLFQNQIRPPFISAESHSVEVFCLLVSLGKYGAYKLLDGYSVAEVYRDASILNLNGDKEVYSFPLHSAGPFGDDIGGDWVPPDRLLRMLGSEGMGWKDIHATSEIVPAPTPPPPPPPRRSKGIRKRISKAISKARKRWEI